VRIVLRNGRFVKLYTFRNRLDCRDLRYYSYLNLIEVAIHYPNVYGFATAAEAHPELDDDANMLMLADASRRAMKRRS